MNTKYITLVLLSCLYCVGAHAAGWPQSQSYYQIYTDAETPGEGYNIKEDHEASDCKRTTIDWYEISDLGSTYDQTLSWEVVDGLKVITEGQLKATPLYRCNIDNGLTNLPSCKDGDVVALPDGKWRCDVGFYDSWEYEGDIPECKHQNGLGDPDPYLIFKNVENAVPYLRDFGHSGDTLYTYSVAKPSDFLCITYACKEGYAPNINVHDDNSFNKKPQCVGGHDECPLYQEGGAKPSAYRLLSTIVTDPCDSTWYPIPGTSDQYHGKRYIKALKENMQTSLQDNADLAQRIFVIDPKNGTFTCDNDGCSLKDDVFDGDKCDFLCAENGFKVRLQHKTTSGGAGEDPCPKYFIESTSGDGMDTKYTCVFDRDAAQDVLNKAATDAKDKCATAICNASNGTYKNNKCMCGNDECTSTTSVNGTPYTYCGGTDGNKFCGKNKESGEWQLARGLPDNLKCDNKKNEKCIDYKNNGIECVKCIIKNSADVKTSCPTSNAADDSANNATDTISALAKTLDEIEDAYGLSKWRTVDGKFNYARLASDATAAVVLGTTGALVTSSVVKKKQVEAGFESLECTVGGQHVGDWGDVFRIDGK